jgi:copper chaperone
MGRQFVPSWLASLYRQWEVNMIETFLETLSVRVDGMCEPRCVRSVCSALGAIPGVLEVEVSLETREAIVRYDRGKASAGQFRTALFAMGFESVRIH